MRRVSAILTVSWLFAESGRPESVGQRMAGAFTGAILEKLPEGGRFNMALFDVRTAGGQRIEARGFTPAHVVAATPVDMAASRDHALEKAFALVRPSLSAREALNARP